MTWRDAWYERIKLYLSTSRHGSVTYSRAMLARIEALEGMVDILIMADSEMSRLSRRYNRETQKEKDEAGV